MSDNTVPRALLEALARHFKNDHRTISAFQQLFDQVETNSSGTTAAVEATDAIQDATVIVLSANTAFANERILRLADGLAFGPDDGTYVTIIPSGLAKAENYDVTFIADGESQLFVPLVGSLVAFENAGANLANYANDAAAAAGGVIIGQLYRNGSVVMVRVT